MLSKKSYSKAVRSLLSPDMERTFFRLTTPKKIQDYLDSLQINFSQTHHSPKFSLQRGSVQCIEGALVAAALLAYHGEEPLLLDLRTLPKDEDHVVALFKKFGRWGAISKTNHAILRYRDPIYLSVRELALSYFNEYALEDGTKTLREFSDPFDLRKFAPEKWITATGNLWWLAEALDDSPHHRILPAGLKPADLRLISPLERKALELTEWKKQKRSNAKRSSRLS
jgi:hypothetical protein